MKIEHMGVRIVCNEGSAEAIIVVTPEQFTLSGNIYCRAEIEALRDALTEALKQYDALGTTPAPFPVFTFYVGQEINGTEDLPVGTRVIDSEEDVWELRSPEHWTLPDNTIISRKSFRDSIVRRYAPMTIVSLP